jgi:hypothetical protein
MSPIHTNTTIPATPLIVIKTIIAIFLKFETSPRMHATSSESAQFQGYTATEHLRLFIFVEEVIRRWREQEVRNYIEHFK